MEVKDVGGGEKGYQNGGEVLDGEYVTGDDSSIEQASDIANIAPQDSRI